MKLLRKALQLDPEVHVAQYNVGRILMSRLKHSEAIEASFAPAQLSPNLPNLTLTLTLI